MAKELIARLRFLSPSASTSPVWRSTRRFALFARTCSRPPAGSKSRSSTDPCRRPTSFLSRPSERQPKLNSFGELEPASEHVPIHILTHYWSDHRALSPWRGCFQVRSHLEKRALAPGRPQRR